MILGLCSSFAVVPAMSMINGGNGTARLLADPAHPLGDPRDAPVSPGSLSLAALVASSASFSDVSIGGVMGPSPASPGGSAGSAKAQGSTARAAATAPASSSSTPRVPRAPAAPPAPAPVAAPAPAASPAAAPAAAAHGVTSHSASASRSQQGVASWLDIAAGTCANNAAPMGAILTVTNAAGVSITCKVVSTGPFVAGRVVDLAESTFARLGLVSQGLVSVTVTW